MQAGAPADLEPSLDRSGEVWVGVFPGLGSVSIDEEGGIEVSVEPAAPADSDAPDAGEDDTLREQALRYGWAEGLSFARRGFTLAGGAAMSPPGDADGCLILCGDPHDAAIVMIELVKQGWTVMGDRFTPTQWEGPTLVAYPRQAPLIIAAQRLAKAGLEGSKIRAHTDARSVDLPRTGDPQPVVAVCTMQMRKPDEDVLAPLTGHERFEAAAGLMMGGALYPAIEHQDDEQPDELDEAATAAWREARVKEVAAESLSKHLQLTTLPYSRLRIDSKTAEDDAAALVTWWESAIAPRRETS